MMATKPEELPSLDDELTVPVAPRPNLGKLKANIDLPDEAVQENSRAIGKTWGASTRIASEPKEPEPLSPLESLRIDLPDYLARELRVRCAEEKVTNAYIVMLALRKEGYHIEDKDLVRDRYKRGKR
jgi:hypothetical protein